MLPPIICYNKQFFYEDEVPLKFNNRAFKFGDSFFETIRCNGNYPIHFNLHYKRMIKALISLKMNIATLPTQNEIEVLIGKLLKKNKLFGASRVRLEVFRSGEGLYTPETNDVSYIIECNKLETPYYTLNEKGLLLSIYTEIKKTYNPLSFFKSGNALPYILASFNKKETNADDCFIVNEKNKIIEATSSNVFWVKDGAFYTPSVLAGCVSGVMRKTLINLINNSDFPKVIEENGVSLNEILMADEIFLCNAIQGIQWVVGYGEKRFFNQKTRQLHTLLNNSVFNSKY